MVDISAIAGTVSALKGAVDITKAMISLHDAEAVKAKVIELNAKILEAQSAAFVANDERAALIERVSQLEKEVADLKAWDAQKQRYDLTDLGNGAFAYAVKESMRAGEPDHKICATCYADRRRSVLQTETWNPGRAEVLVCHQCGSAVYVHGMPHPDHQKLRRPARRS
jgi:hypothetical protein